MKQSTLNNAQEDDSDKNNKGSDSGRIIVYC